MKNLRILVHQAAALGAALMVLAGCSSFQGPGDYQTADEYEELPPAEVTLRGERRTYVAETELNFDWPVEDAAMSRGFQMGKRPHWGLDLANRKGTKILASETGYVIYTGRGFRGYGNLIVIEHGAEWATLYSHLDKILVKEGQKVARGEVIGLMGRTGRASGVHLHFEIRQNRQPVNPLGYLPPAAGVITQR